MAQHLQLFLKCPHRIQIRWPRAARIIVAFLKCRPEAPVRLASPLKAVIRHLLNSSSFKLPRLREKQSHKHIALSHRLVIFILQPRVRHRIKEMLPAHGLEIQTALPQFVILLSEVQIERIPILP